MKIKPESEISSHINLKIVISGLFQVVYTIVCPSLVGKCGKRGMHLLKNRKQFSHVN